MTDCIFCRIAAKEIPARVRYEDADVVAFDDIQPKAPVHVLVVPTRHIARVQDFADADATLAGRLLLVAKRVAEQAGIGESGYRLIMNCGPDGGQEVAHLHLHVLGGRKMGAMLANAE